MRISERISTVPGGSEAQGCFWFATNELLGYFRVFIFVCSYHEVTTYVAEQDSPSRREEPKIAQKFISG